MVFCKFNECKKIQFKLIWSVKMSENNLHHIEIKQPTESWVGTKVILDGEEVHGVTSVNYSVAVEENPKIQISMKGIHNLDINTNNIVFDIAPTNLREAVIILQEELKKHGDLYNAFLASIESSLSEHCSMCVGKNSNSNREVAEKILKRIIGEE